MSKLVPIISQKDLENISLSHTGFGISLKAFHVAWNTDVSVKLLSNQRAGERDFKTLLQEAANTQRLQCNHLLPLLGICQFQGFLGVATTWMQNGSLSLFIHDGELYPDLPVPLSLRILSDVATGLSYLHSLEPPILHHHLKPSNVLLDLEYRAKISDFGQPTWRKQQLRAALQNCNEASCWDLLYLSPEILQGGQFSQKGDVYSFGMMCWELLSRQKPLTGKKTLIQAITGVCNGLRPGIEAAFIPNALPHRNKLIQLMLLCWHQELHFRPNATECAAFLKDILSTFPKEVIPDAIYNLICAKECAINAAKGPVSHLLETGMRNLELICPQNNNVPNKEIVLKPQSLSCETGNPGNKLNQTVLVSNTPRGTALGRDPSISASNGSNLPSIVLPPHSKISNNKTRPFNDESKDYQPPFLQTVGEPTCCKNCPHNWPNSTLTGPTCKTKNCSILTLGRETILSSMTEGRLNHLLDVLRAQQLLPRPDYEMIRSYPTLTGRTRALIDTCLNLGEQAAEAVVTVLSSSKGSLSLRKLQQTR
ncbi:PREDICTED: receptor-interacting serine/threonine-protein kinase 2-like [Thamnophis sirtalis]|uniref:Receptor-interacting serine/threonine-protein kinase 2-like n=1 Tax=Thamnophis sirtalis TaxID=35019 RepID=A0A6I9XEC3_9SAUR|nr:PREDICTED: receptor-interacting serine/threonine-protein kinase 2-like [Thamnophis sirtalis]XP_013912547.1 PREDICTED: receptor-interacting serine/threonine-protein kinase 2-like [Thamnophis sirtalis]